MCFIKIMRLRNKPFLALILTTLVWAGLFSTNKVGAREVEANELEANKAAANDEIELGYYSMKLSIETSASKADVWAIWEDVDNWKDFDERLQYSYLIDDAEFKAGATGLLKGKNAPKTRFVLAQVDQGVSFTQVLKLPLGQTVHLKRYFEKTENANTKFTHEVIFKGRLRSIYHLILAGPFKKDLKKVMPSLKKLAEEKHQ